MEQNTMTEIEKIELDVFRKINTQLFTATQIDPDDQKVLSLIQTMNEMQAAVYADVQNNDENMSCYNFKISQLNKTL